MIVNKKSIYTYRLISDLLLLNVAFFLSAVFAQSFEILLLRTQMFVLLLLANILWFFYSNSIDFYDEFYSRPFAYQFTNILKNVAFQTVLAVLFIFLVKEDLFTRNFILFYAFLLIALISLRTVFFKKILKSLRKKGKGIRNLLIVGSGETAKNFVKTISSNPEFGYKFIGYVTNDNTAVEENIIGKIENIDSILNKNKIDEVVIALPQDSSENLDELIRICNINAVSVHIIPDYFRFLADRFQVSTIGKLPIITARDEPLNEVNWRFIKRAFDIFFSFLFLIFIFSWLYPIIAILIKLSSSGPVFFIQERTGTKNKRFKCIKFRTLTHTGNTTQLKFKPVVTNDPRITGTGKFLRKTNIDEIPQFINVLLGDMSVVGPRPHALMFDQQYQKIFEEIKLRYNVRPGITGWAQIHGLRGDIEDEAENKKRLQKRLEFDLWYIENWSFKLDMQIILMTIWQMIKGDTKGI